MSKRPADNNPPAGPERGGKAPGKRQRQSARAGSSRTTTPTTATPAQPPLPVLRPPETPPDSHRLTGKNGLDRLPPDRRISSRPCFIYDYVDPAPKFRMMGENYDWSTAPDYIVEGRNLEDLVENHEERKTIPVLEPGYK